jgi:PEP-CTERM motif
MKPMKKSTNHRLAQAVALTIAASAVSQGYAAETFFINTLAIDPTGKADLQDNALIVGSTPYATVAAYVVSGFNTFAWDGYGINSSTAATFVQPTSLGIADNADAFFATFNSVPVTATSTMIRYTYYGDCDLSGKVDNDDYALIDAGFSASSGKWFLGDLDYTGVVDNDDYALIDAGFSGQGTPLGGGGAYFAAPGKASGVVPEPSIMALLSLGVVSFLGRRRSSNQSR